DLTVPAAALAEIGAHEDVVAVDHDPDRNAVPRSLRRGRLDVDLAGLFEERQGRRRKAHAASGSGGPAIASACRSGGRNARAASIARSTFAGFTPIRTVQGDCPRELPRVLNT